MSFLAIAGFVIFGFYLLTQFGRQIHAKNATSWWLIMMFLLVGIAHPSSYEIIARILGIQLVSNFVFGVMVLFLLKTTLENAAEGTLVIRKLREFVCNDAMTRFCARTSGPAAGSGKKSVLVILPTYNEQENITAVSEEFKAHLAQADGRYAISICFINDGSKDASAALLREHWPDNHISHQTNVGVSGVLLTGFKCCLALGYDYVLQCDADGQHPIDRIPDLVSTAVETGSDLTIGSRFVDKGGEHDLLESTTAVRRLGGRIISITLKTLFGSTRVKDPTSGFRVYSRKAIAALVANMPDDYPEPESIAICLQHGMKITETPVRMRSRQGGVTSISGLRSIEFMIKVVTSLLSIRARTLLTSSR